MKHNISILSYVSSDADETREIFPRAIREVSAANYPVDRFLMEKLVFAHAKH